LAAAPKWKHNGLILSPVVWVCQICRRLIDSVPAGAYVPTLSVGMCAPFAPFSTRTCRRHAKPRHDGATRRLVLTGRKLHERTGNVDENKGQPTTSDNRLQGRERARAIFACSLNTKSRSKSPLPWKIGARGGAVARRPGRVRGWFPSIQTFLPLIPLLAARILAYLAVPPETRRSQQTFLLWGEGKTPHPSCSG